MTTIRIGSQHSAHPGYHETGTAEPVFYQDHYAGSIIPWRDGPAATWQYRTVTPDGITYTNCTSRESARWDLIAHRQPAETAPPAVVVTPSGLQTLMPGCEPSPEVKGDTAQQRMF